jgi:hypothetical protein
MSFIPNPYPTLAVVTRNGQQRVDFLAWFNDGVVIDDRHCLAGGRPGQIEVRLLPEAKTQRIIKPRGFVVHTQGGPRQATNDQAWGFFNVRSKNESHIVGPDMVKGNVIQAMPFNIRADSNFEGNEWEYPRGSGQWWGHLSMETQDAGAATVQVTEWPLPQLGTMIAIITACCATYTIPCTDVPSPFGGGIAPHNRWPQWSKDAHSCPGVARTRQMDYLRSQVAGRLAHYYQAVGLECPS